MILSSSSPFPKQALILVRPTCRLPKSSVPTDPTGSSAAANQWLKFDRSSSMSNQLPLHLVPPLHQQQPENGFTPQLPLSTENAFTLELAKVQLLLAAISQNTQSPVFALIPNSINNNNNNNNVIQQPLSIDTSTPPLLPPHPLNNPLPTIVATESGLVNQTSDQVSSNILHELLTGSDISQVRNRSNLLELGFVPSTDGGSTRMDDSSDTSSITNYPIKLEPPPPPSQSSDDVGSDLQTQQSILIERLLDLLKTQTITNPINPTSFSDRQRKSDQIYLRSYSTPIKDANHTNSVYPENRPRSYSDLHHVSRHHHKLKRPHADETDKLTQEIESSLFAQLVLTPESSPSPSSSSTSRVHRTIDHIADQLTANQSNRANHYGQPEPSLCRQRLFEWLREADLFVAEHCRDIPLGTLLSVAISSEQTHVTELLRTLCKSPSTTDSLPRSAKQVLDKCWHHLLLISLMEHQFYPQTQDNKDQSKFNERRHLDWDKRCAATFPGNDAKLEELLRLLASLTTSNADGEDEDDNFSISQTQLQTELTDLIQATSNLKLNATVFDSMRFCILAQNAYPRHFSTTYKEALSSLENGLPQSTDERLMMMLDILKLLNRLHCFDANHLRKFLALTSDPPDNNNSTQPDDYSSPPTSSSIPGREVNDSRFSKRKPHLTVPLVTSSHVRLRTRAYTTSVCSKSARMCYTVSKS